MLYPIYSEQWNLSPVVITAVFATYPAVLIVVLLLSGDLSDVIGRRRVMLASIALIAVSAVVFAVASNVWFLFAGRVLQGAGAGMAMGTASAALVENNISRNHRLPSSLATVATSTGLAVALVISGALAQFVTPPAVWSFVVLLLLAVVTIVVLARTRDDRPVDPPRWRPRTPRLAPGVRSVYAIASLSVSLAYSVGAIFLALGAHMIRQFVETDSLLIIGLLLGTSAAAIGITGLLLSRVPPHAAVWSGAVLTLASLGLMTAIPAAGSLGLFLLWCLVGGAAYSFAFTGGLGLVNRAAPPHHRGATLSLVYLVAYVLQAATALGAGSVATAHGLGPAVGLAAAALALLCAAVLVLMTLETRRRKGRQRRGRNRARGDRRDESCLSPS